MDADFVQRAYLIKCGIPFDVAWSLGYDEVLAYCITFCEMEGVSVFDWGAMKWQKRQEEG